MVSLKRSGFGATGSRLKCRSFYFQKSFLLHKFPSDIPKFCLLFEKFLKLRIHQDIQKSIFSAPKTSFLSTPWKLPVPSYKVKKIIAPCPRIDMMRPAIHFSFLFFSKLSKLSTASFKEIALFESAGYGSIPAFRSRFIFFIRMSLISSSEDIFIPPQGRLRHFYYFIIYRSPWSLEGYPISLFFSEHSRAERRTIGNFSFSHGGFLRTHYHINLLFGHSRFLHHYFRSHLNNISALTLNYLGRLKNLFDLLDPDFEFPLILPRLVIFRVLR